MPENYGVVIPTKAVLEEANTVAEFLFRLPQECEMLAERDVRVPNAQLDVISGRRHLQIAFCCTS